MSEIDNGIKQPLRFYDEVTKQNFRHEWVKDGGLRDHHILICPENAIVPFQVRRRRSAAVVTTFDLYSYDGSTGAWGWELDLLSVIPAPSTNHLKVIQMETADNIVWYPTADFTTPLSCGLHYVHLSDGVNDWYSEVFQVVADFTDTTKTYISIFSDATVTGQVILSKDGTTNNAIIKDNKPF